MAPRKKTQSEPQPEPKTMVFETFLQIGSYEIGNMKRDDPSCFNGNVSVKRYRVTIEEIEDPDDVIRARLQKLWDECDNHHHREPLRAVAKRYGLELAYKF